MAIELTTYAQNREDLYLYALLSDVKKGFYVDVGANHEKLHSVTRLFYEHGWRGINIEPNSVLVKELKRYRKRDINLQVGVSNKNGKMTFREYPDFDGLSTLSKEIQGQYESLGYAFKDYSILVQRLENIFEANRVQEIDFLKVDVEGHELEVLESNNWEVYRPKIVLFEGTDRENCITFVEGKGYRLEFFDGLNYYMVDNNHKDITIHNFAGAVLSKGIYTEREKQLIKNLHELDVQLGDLQNQLSHLHESIKEGIGIKMSLHSLKKSVRRKVLSRKTSQ